MPSVADMAVATKKQKMLNLGMGEWGEDNCPGMGWGRGAEAKMDLKIQGCGSK